MIDIGRYPGSQTLIGQIMRAPLRLIPRDAVVPILQGPLRGKRWIVGSGISRLWLGSYEVEWMKLAGELVSEGDTVFDIGANAGIFMLLFSQLVGRSGHVASFEPSGTNVDYLRKHILLNDAGNVTVVEAAVTSSCGVAHFEPTTTSSTGHLAEKGPVEVRTTTIDAFVAATGRRPDVMKIDVEGEELEVLVGAEQTLSRVRPRILLEAHSADLSRSCTALLEAKGYRVQMPVDRHARVGSQLVARHQNHDGHRHGE